ncbi:MAG: hypothetical protein ACUVUG_07330 [Candidatus Aminicenantia bacterium]
MGGEIKSFIEGILRNLEIEDSKKNSIGKELLLEEEKEKLVKRGL